MGAEDDDIGAMSWEGVIVNSGDIMHGESVQGTLSGDADFADAQAEILGRGEEGEGVTTSEVGVLFSEMVVEGVAISSPSGIGVRLGTPHSGGAIGRGGGEEQIPLWGEALPDTSSPSGSGDRVNKSL